MHPRTPPHPGCSPILLLSLIRSLACVGASDLVADTFTLTPPKIEQYFGISRGHIHHVDNSFGFTDRFPYSTSIQASCTPCQPASTAVTALPLPLSPCQRPKQAPHEQAHCAQPGYIACLWLTLPRLHIS